MKAKSALTLAMAAGICGTAMGEVPIDVPGHHGPKHMKKGDIVGHVYYKVSTGEMVYTPAAEYEANKSRGVRAAGDDINGDGVADYWVATNTDICAPTVSSTGIATGIAAIDAAPTFGDFHHYKGQLVGTDNLVESIQFIFWTDIVDNDTDLDGFGDGADNKGMEITFWDREDVFGQASSVCPTGTSGTGALTRAGVVSYGFIGLGGPTTPPAPGFLAGIVYTFDLSGGSEMELADSDGLGPTSGFFNAGIATADVLDPFDLDSDGIFQESDGFIDGDTDGNGSFDFGYSLRGIQPTLTISGGTGPTATGTIGYSLVAYGANGTGGQINPSTLATTPPYGVTTDGLADYFDRLDQTPANADHTRMDNASIIEPMASGFPFLSAVVPTIPSRLQRFSLFQAALAETPTVTQVAGGAPLCEGLPTSDFFFYGQRHDTDGDTIAETTDTFVGGLNCVSDLALDTNGDTAVDTAPDGIVDGQPSALAYLSLGGMVDFGNPCPCDIEGDGDLDPDDIAAFVTAFTTGDLAADVEGDGDLDPDDIAAFVSCFTSPPSPDCDF